jgi:hypothetical protein
MVWSRQDKPLHPEQVAELIRLRDMEHASWRKIGKQLNISRMNAYRLYHRWTEDPSARGRKYLAKAKQYEERAKMVHCAENREWHLILARAYRMLAEAEVGADQA